MHRFHIPPERWDPARLTLDEPGVHHCLDVLRLAPGQRVTVFDGRGMEATAEIVGVEKKSVLLRVLHSAQGEPLPCRISLAQAVPKGKNMDFIIQKATELGTAEIIPLLSDRVVRQFDPADAAHKLAKWNAVAVEAAKQCGQNWLPHIANPVSPKEFFARPPEAELPLIASLQADSRPFREILRIHREEHGHSPRSALILIGPEGDFTPAETALAKSAGCLPVTLGPIVLRTETAAIYSLSVLAHELFFPADS